MLQGLQGMETRAQEPVGRAHYGAAGGPGRARARAVGMWAAARFLYLVLEYELTILIKLAEVRGIFFKRTG